MNMIQNAVEHTKEMESFILRKSKDGRLTFIVEDEGSGFKAFIAWHRAVFMDDTSRNGEAHYGMGLFFAKLWLKNMVEVLNFFKFENTGGARGRNIFLSSQETS